MNAAELPPLKLLIRGFAGRVTAAGPVVGIAGDTDAVAQVDPDDDDIDRWVVRRYAYDPLRHERRHQVVAAFDNDSQCMVLLARSREQLQQRRDAGEDIDVHEYYFGVDLEAGYRQSQQNSRLIWRAIGRADIDGVRERLEPPGEA
jgi:hypothetical protein